MRRALAAILALAACLAAANMLGIASAEAPTTTSVRTVTVVGVAAEPISQSATREEADAAYRQAMGSAMTDGQGKAEFLAAKAGGALGAVQSIDEHGGSVTCLEGAEDYAGYTGEVPDYPSEGGRVLSLASTPAVKPGLKKKKKAHPVAKKSSAVSCKVAAEVGLVYVLQ